jgi:urease accessory protein
MLEIYERLGLDDKHAADAIVVLTHEQRTKGRLLVHAVDGREVRIFLDRGKTLLVGEFLQSQCGRVVQVLGAEESITRASCDDWLAFSRACYHLGNRHVKLQVGERWLRMTPDHVLEEMLEHLGLKVEPEITVFEPESGAYSHGHHDH